jgi:hypothetical protein
MSKRSPPVARRKAQSLRPSSSPTTAGLHPEGYEAGFAAERPWQLERLVVGVGLAVSAT